MAVVVQAHDVRTCRHDEFRALIREIVSEGNKQYKFSSRSGIMQMADSIGCLLRERSLAGNLNGSDSLEFTADQYKLYGDYHYESGSYDKLSYNLAEEYFQLALSIYLNNSCLMGKG